VHAEKVLLANFQDVAPLPLLLIIKSLKAAGNLSTQQSPIT
jgi:hypothetical protein